MFVPLAATLLAVGIGACGHAGAGSVSSSRATSTVATNTIVPDTNQGMDEYEAPTRLHGLRGDDDHDASSWDDGYHKPDDDNDEGMDHQPSDEHEGYRDSDDLDSLRVGHPASPAQANTIEALVRRYYAVAATGDGAKACSMMARSFAQATPLDYGKFGPPYLHGAKTCARVTTLQFEHSRDQITSPIQITAVHIETENRAYAYFGSRTTPASEIAVLREGGNWKIGALLGGPMP